MSSIRFMQVIKNTAATSVRILSESSLLINIACVPLGFKTPTSSRIRRKCFVLGDGRSLSTTWLQSPVNGTVKTGKIPLQRQQRRRRVAIFTGCSANWRLDDEAKTRNGIYRLKADGFGNLCADRNDKNGTSCSVDDIVSAFARWRITDVHVALDAADFNLHDSAADGQISFADLLRCYVAMLEAVVLHDKRTSVFFHVFDDASHDRSTALHDVDRSRDIGFISDYRTCLDPFPDIGLVDYEDALLSAAFGFMTVYENLYKLEHVHVTLHR